MNNLIEETMICLSGKASVQESVASASLLSLVERVAEHGDRKSLEELVCRRRLFRWENSSHLRLSEFLLDYMFGNMPKRTRRATLEITDRAYDLTLEKFSFMNGLCLGRKIPKNRKRSGTECRNYYRAFLQMVKASPPSGTALERDADVAALLQRFIIRHIYLSLREAKRTANPSKQRYTWHVNGRSIALYMPRHMKGAQKRQWLKTEIPEEWLDKADAKQRIQEYIDKQFNTQTQESQLTFEKEALVVISDTPPGVDLGAALATEKIGHIQGLQPAIRALGAEQLRSLILDIFNNLESDEYNQAALARQYGLSTASLSRFAGCHWENNKQRKNNNSIPCLWRNLAGLVARDTRLVEAAQLCGVWPEIQTAANIRTEREDDENR